MIPNESDGLGALKTKVEALELHARSEGLDAAGAALLLDARGALTSLERGKVALPDGVHLDVFTAFAAKSGGRAPTSDEVFFMQEASRGKGSFKGTPRR